MGGDVESAAPPAANFMQDFFNQVAGVKRDMETVHGNIKDLEEKQNKAITDVYGGKGVLSNTLSQWTAFKSRSVQFRHARS